VDKLVEFFIVNEREKRTFDRGNARREHEVCSLFILWSHFEAVLEYAVYNPPNTK
jgi:hypothetical protein